MADLPIINYIELNNFTETNLADADTFFVYNSIRGEPQQLSWEQLKDNFSFVLFPNYVVKIGNVLYEFNSENTMDITQAFSGLVRTDGTSTFVSSYIPTLPTHSATKGYVDSKNAFNIVYKNLQSIGSFLDSVPATLEGYLKIDGSSLLPTTYVPTQPKQIAPKDYVDGIVNGYLKADGTVKLTGNLDLNNFSILNLNSPVNLTDATPKSYVDNSLSSYLKLSGVVPMTGNLNLGSNKITNLATPTDPTDATPKSYVDTIGNQSIKLNGSTTPTANIPMGNFKLTGLSAGTASGQSVRFDEIATAPKVRLKDEPNYTGLNIVVSTNAATPTNLLTGLASSTPNAFLTASKLQPLNQPTEFSIQANLTGSFTASGVNTAFMVVTLVAGASSKQYKLPLGSTNTTGPTPLGAIAVPYQIDVGGNAVTNGIQITSYVTNGTATITSISLVLSQYNV